MSSTKLKTEKNKAHINRLSNNCLTASMESAEEKLIEAYSIINRSSSVAITWKNMEGWPVEFVTQNIYKLIEYTAEELLAGAISYSDCIHPDDLQRVADEVAKFSRDDEIKEFVHEPYRIISKDGTVRIINDWTFITRNDQGQITHYKGIIEDITKRRRIEEELREKNRLTQIILDSLPFPAMLIKKDRVIIASNKVARDIGAKVGGVCWRDFGQADYIPQKDKEYINLHNCVPDGKTKCTFCLADETIDTNKLHNLPELQIFDKIWDTYWIPVDYKIFLHFAIDITERKQMEQKLRKRTNDLGKRVKELGCLYSISKLIQNQSYTYQEILQGVIELIPPSLQYPKITCVKLTIENKEIKTANFQETAWSLNSKIIVSEIEIGLLEIFYLEKQPKRNEGPFLKEERALIDAITERLGRYIERKRAQDDLRHTNEQLTKEKISLKEKNITLKEVLNQFEKEKHQIAFQTQSNVDRVVIPILNKLEEKIQSDNAVYIKLLRDSLSEITDPFINNMETRFSKLTPREIEICNLIKNGLSSKEIASALNTSVGTVFNQRKTIRKKLGIANDEVNLNSFLQTR